MSGFQLPHWVYTAVVLTITVVVCTRGDRDAKISHGAWTVGWILSMMNYRFGNDPQWGIMPIDVAILAVTTFVALRSARYWPMVTAAFALLLVANHVVKIAIPTIDGWTYLSCGIFFSYLGVFSVAYGAWTAPSWHQAQTGAEPEATPAYGGVPVAAAASARAPARPAEVAAPAAAQQPARRRVATERPAHEPA